MMIQGAPVVLGGKKKSNVPAFAYTGKYNVRDDDVVELLESGEITFVEDGVIDVFMVGGGAGGIEPSTGGADSYYGYPGGAGGYTRTVRRVTVAANTGITVTIGAGGAVKNSYPWTGTTGGASSFNNLTVKGAEIRGQIENILAAKTKGGSGGGGGVVSNSDYGAGGSDGTNGEAGYYSSANIPSGGEGQGFTTREFGEATGKLYAGGGGGGRGISSQLPVVSPGGSGGGGTGGWCASTTLFQPAAAGVANTGGGGGGGARSAASGDSDKIAKGGSGGSGIVCFREAVELPELAGTWVLNERLYAPESDFQVYTSFTVGSSVSTQYAASLIWTYTTSGLHRLSVQRTTGAENVLYNFGTNTWDYKYKYLVFPTGATASDEFRAWLASNATKQS